MNLQVSLPLAYSSSAQQRRAEKTEGEMLHTVTETAKRFGVSDYTVWRMIYDGQLPCTRVRRAVRIPEDAIQAWISENTTSAQVA